MQMHTFLSPMPLSKMEDRFSIHRNSVCLIIFRKIPYDRFEEKNPYDQGSASFFCYTYVTKQGKVHFKDENPLFISSHSNAPLILMLDLLRRHAECK